MLDGYQLMVPGPTQVRQDVLDQMMLPVVPHYGRDWTAYYNETLDLLRSVFRTKGKIFPIPGSGSAGLEAALSSMLEKTETLLILSNGWFGDRLVAIAEGHLDTVLVERAAPEEPMTEDRLRDALARHPEAVAVAVVHSESSSGLLNPVRELAAVCREHGLLFFVDAVSSAGGIELAVDDWGIDICVTASQKCLESPPGFGIVSVSPSGWKRIAAKRTPGWYLNLHVWEEFAASWADWHPYPITQAVPTFRAMRRALEYIDAEGLAARVVRHAAVGRQVRTELGKHGFSPVFDESKASPTILAFLTPPGCESRCLVDALRDKHGILIASGMGSYKERAIRIGNMGVQSSSEQMKPVIAALAAEGSGGCVV